MKINRKITTVNYKKGNISRVRYLVVHYVGSLSDAENNANYFYKKYRGSSAHYFVGYNGDIWQSVEDSDIAWHCGAKKYLHPQCRNSNSIGIELCCKTNGSSTEADDKWYFENATIESAIMLITELMRKYNIPIENVLRHYDVTGKICPAPFVFNNGNVTWGEFLSRIEGGMNTNLVETDNSKIIWDYLTGTAGFSDVATAGIMGNLYAESRLSPINLQNSYEKKLGMSDESYTKAIDDGSYSRDQFINDKAGYGIAQWTYGARKASLYDTAKYASASIGNLYIQLSFLVSEIKANKKLYENLRNSKMISNASNFILHDFERPADQSEKVERKRAEYSETFYYLYAVKKDKKSNNLEFRVRVNIDDLNIRTGPGKEYPRIGKFTGKGVFTIIESQNGWGKLKSGVGWIFLELTERI